MSDKKITWKEPPKAEVDCALFVQRSAPYARYTETTEATLDDLRLHLVARGGEWEVLGEQNLMCARNQELCSLDEPLAEGDEVAFFPPVTGG
jgi:molybdopterin converting factor small subunit